MPADSGVESKAPAIDTKDQFKEIELQFKYWVSGTAAGSQMLWQAWRAVDYNGNNIVSLAEIDNWIVATFPKLNNKPALMRAYKCSDLNQDAYVCKREFPILLRNVIYFNKVLSAFKAMDVDADWRMSFREFQQGVASLGLAPADPRALFDSLDRNHGGLVLFDEFCLWVASVQCRVDGSIYAPEVTMSNGYSSKTTQSPDPEDQKKAPAIDTKDQFKEIELQFKYWVSGTAAGSQMLWQAWRAMDYNGNNIVSLAEIDNWIVATFPKLNNKPALMRAYKSSDLNQDAYVNKREFPILLRNVIYFNKVSYAFKAMDVDADWRMSFREFQQGVASLGLAPADPRALFDSLDRNHGGLVLFDEFCLWVASVQCRVDGSIYAPEVTMSNGYSSKTTQIPYPEDQKKVDASSSAPKKSVPPKSVPPNGSKSAPPEADTVRSVFAQYDLQDGKISEEELLKILRKIELQFGAKDVKRLLEKAECGGGSIDFHAFVSWLFQ